MTNLFRGDVSRRQLLTGAGLGVVSATAIGSLADAATAQQPASAQPTPRGGELPPQIQFPQFRLQPSKKRVGRRLLYRVSVPHTPGGEGLQDQKLIGLIYQAAQTHQTITLPPVTGLDVTRGPAPRMLK